MAAQVGAEALTKVRRAEHRDDRLGPRRGVLHHVLQQLHDVEHLDTAIAQALCGDVVLLLSPGDPGQPGKQQPVLGARGEAEQFGSRAMGKHGPQPPDFTIDAMNMAHNQPPSYAGTPWLDKPVAGSYHRFRGVLRLPARPRTAGLPLEHHCAQSYENSLLNEAFVML